jgi:hypothetical protein
LTSKIIARARCFITFLLPQFPACSLELSASYLIFSQPAVFFSRINQPNTISDSVQFHTPINIFPRLTKWQVQSHCQI